jgi:hypothetical protein
VYLTCIGVRLLYALQHKLPPFYHNLGPRFNKTEFVRVCRLSGIHQNATCFEVAIDEIWRLLDSAAAGLVAWEHGRQVLKLGEMANKYVAFSSSHDMHVSSSSNGRCSS